MNNKKKIAIIGASYLQVPIILKAKQMGLETHVFAWKVGDEGEKLADYFYPISITEKELILERCREIGIHGICSIASDLAVVAVNYVAQNMNLNGNSELCTLLTTNKYNMRMALEKGGLPIPKVYFSNNNDLYSLEEKDYPVICKPTDRSGSRGVNLVNNENELKHAIKWAKKESLEGRYIIEEYIEGEEYSIECVTWRGTHQLLAVTKKYTTGAPNFIEKGHLEPAELTDDLKNRIRNIIYRALDVLLIENGASHSEIKINSKGEIKIIEIGSRMGGDLIGSSLVPLSTGIDFTEQVIRIALGECPQISFEKKTQFAAVRYIFDKNDIDIYTKIKREWTEIIVEEDIKEVDGEGVVDSSTRKGYFVIVSEDKRLINTIMG